MVSAQATKQLLEFYADWDSTIAHITAFGLKLNKEGK
jgi:hypothetical protein